MLHVFTPFRTNHWAKGAQSCADSASSGRRAACLLCCKPLKWAFHCSKLIASVARPVLQLKPMQVCFVRGVGSPRSHARNLACNAPVCRSPQPPITWGLREPARIHTKTERTQSGDRANPDLAKQAGRACAMGSNCPITSSAALALQAGLPQAKTWSCLTPTLSTDEFTDEEFRRKASLTVMLCSRDM
jgi:hypothetical protein